MFMNALNTIIVAFSVFLTIGASAQTNAPGSVRVNGKTVDAQGKAIAGVVVENYAYYQSRLNRFELEPRQRTTSDTNGSFELQISRASAFPQAPAFLVARKPGL